MDFILRSFLILAIAVPFLSFAQDEPLQLLSDGIVERQVSTYSLDRNNATLIITTLLNEIALESNGRPVTIAAEEEEMKMFILPPGSHTVTIRAEGFLPLALETAVLRKNKVYDVAVTYSLPAADTVIAKPSFGSLSIRTDPPGAAISVNGVSGEWMTPAVLADLPPAEYTVTMRKADYADSTITVRVNADSLIFLPSISLQPLYGYFIIDSAQFAHYSLNGVELNNVFSSIYKLRYGWYTLEVQKLRYKKFQKEFYVPPADTVRFAVSLVPDFAHFDFSRMDRRTALFLDSIAAPRAEVETFPGLHSIRIINEVIGTVTKEFIIEPGERRTLTENDFQHPGRLIVYSDVPASLFVNSKPASLSTMLSNLSPGRHSVRLVHEEYGEERRFVDLVSDETKELFIPLNRSRSTEIVLSLVPGANQLYRGSTGKGLLFMSAFALSVAGSYYFVSEYDRLYTSYIADVNEYQSTTDPIRASQLNIAISAAYPDVTTQQDRQYLALGVAGSIFLWNIIDIFLFDPEYHYDSGSSRLLLRTAPDDVAVMINVQF